MSDATTPVLSGRLTFHPARHGEPARLSWSGRCPSCRRVHYYGRADPSGDLAETRHRAAHCADGLLVGGGYYIGLTDDDANRQALDAYHGAMTAGADLLMFTRRERR